MGNNSTNREQIQNKREKNETRYQGNIPCAVTFLWRNAKLLKKIFEKLD